MRDRTFSISRRVRKRKIYKKERERKRAKNWIGGNDKRIFKRSRERRVGGLCQKQAIGIKNIRFN